MIVIVLKGQYSLIALYPLAIVLKPKKTGNPYAGQARAKTSFRRIIELGPWSAVISAVDDTPLLESRLLRLYQCCLRLCQIGRRDLPAPYAGRARTKTIVSAKLGTLRQL